MNDSSPVFVARDGRHELINQMLSREQVDELVARSPNRPVQTQLLTYV